MTMRTVIRTSLMAAAVLAAPGCASSGARVADAAWGPVEGPLCSVRVRNAYDVPVQAGARAGAREISLGVVGPEGKRDFRIPCSFRAVTVFRVIRAGEPDEARLGARARALDPNGVTELTLTPVSTRPSFRPMG